MLELPLMAAAFTSQTLIVCCAGIPLLYYAFKHLFTPKPLPGIPFEQPTSFMGDIPSLVASAKKTGGTLDWFTAHAKKHGPISQVCDAFENRLDCQASRDAYMLKFVHRSFSAHFPGWSLSRMLIK